MCSSCDKCERALRSYPLGPTYLIEEATPPRRIVSLCSVKARSFDRGYSRSTSSLNGSADRGVKKNVRPAGTCEA